MGANIEQVYQTIGELKSEVSGINKRLDDFFTKSETERIEMRDSIRTDFDDLEKKYLDKFEANHETHRRIFERIDAQDSRIDAIDPKNRRAQFLEDTLGKFRYLLIAALGAGGLKLIEIVFNWLKEMI